MRLLLLFVVFAIVFSSTKLTPMLESNITSRSHYAAYLIDKQLDFTELIIVAFREYAKLDLLDKSAPNLKEDKKKRLLLLHECYSMISTRKNYFLFKHNDIFKGYFNILFPNDHATMVSPETEAALRKEHVELSRELKHFFLHELPDFYHEYGRNMGVQFSENELDSDMKTVGEMRERGAKETNEFAKRMGVEESNVGVGSRT